MIKIQRSKETQFYEHEIGFTILITQFCILKIVIIAKNPQNLKMLIKNSTKILSRITAMKNANFLVL